MKWEPQIGQDRFYPPYSGNLAYIFKNEGTHFELSPKPAGYGCLAVAAGVAAMLSVLVFWASRGSVVFWLASCGDLMVLVWTVHVLSAAWKVRRAGAVLVFDAAFGRLSLPAHGLDFDRSQFVAIQYLRVFESESDALQISVVVTSPDGQFGRYFLLATWPVADEDANPQLRTLRQFMSAANLPESLILRQDEAR